MLYLGASDGANLARIHTKECGDWRLCVTPHNPPSFAHSQSFHVFIGGLQWFYQSRSALTNAGQIYEFNPHTTCNLG